MQALFAMLFAPSLSSLKSARANTPVPSASPTHPPSGQSPRPQTSCAPGALVRSARARTLAPGEVWVYKPLLPSALRCSYSSPSISISQKSTFMFSKIDTGRGACSSVSLSQISWPEKDVLFLWLSKFFKNFDSLSQNIVEIIACSVLLALCLKTHRQKTDVLFLWLFGSKESAKMSCVLFWPVCLKRLLNTSHVLVFCFVSLKNIF